MSDSTQSAPKQKNWFRRHWILTAILAFIVIGVISNAGNSNKDGSGSYNEPKEKKDYVEINCADFSDKFGVQSDLSDLQKDELFKKYKGKYVKWAGEVSSISSTFGRLQMQVKCSANTLVSDTMISFDDSEKEILLEIKEEQQVQFEGKLDSWGQLLPTTIKKGKIIK